MRPRGAATRRAVGAQVVGEILAPSEVMKPPGASQRRSGLWLWELTLPSNAPDDCLDASLTRPQ